MEGEKRSAQECKALRGWLRAAACKASQRVAQAFKASSGVAQGEGGVSHSQFKPFLARPQADGE